MIPFRKSLAFRLLIISFILLALPLLIDSFIIVESTYQNALIDAKEHLVNSAHSRGLPLAQIQPVDTPFLILIQDYFNLKKNFPQKPNPKIDSKLKELAQTGAFEGIYFLKMTQNNQYIVVNSNLPNVEGQDFTNLFQTKNLFSIEVFTRGYITYLLYHPESKQPYFMMARLVYNEDDTIPLGIILITSEIGEKLKRYLALEKKPYEVNYAILLPNSIVFAASDPSFVFQYFIPLGEEKKRLFLQSESAAKDLLPSRPLTISTGVGYPFIEFTWKGKEQIGYVKPFEGPDISLLVYASKKAIFEKPFIDFIDVYGIYGIILLIGGAVAFFFTHRLSRPMRKLSWTMTEIQRGNLQSRYAHDPIGFEINTLGSIFNEMVETLLQKKHLVEDERVIRETYEKELRIGQQVQRSLLPEKMPNYPGVEIADRYIPAREVAGDFFDFFVREKNGEEEIIITIADASGKGVSACFYSLGVRNMLRVFAREYDNVGQVLSKANELFYQDTGDTGMFITVFTGSYNRKTKIFRYYSCGHNPALLRKSNGEVRILNHLGISMGFQKHVEGVEQKITLDSGDLIVLYTDGITEAHDEFYRQFSEEKLIHFISQEGYRDVGDIAEQLVLNVNAFVGKIPQHDDITLLIMKIL